MQFIVRHSLFVLFKAKRKTILSTSSSYTAHHPGLRASPPALPLHLWQQLAAPAPETGGENPLCELRFLIFCQKGRFCAVGTRSVSGCWPLARLWSPRLEGRDVGLAAAGGLPCAIPSKANGKWGLLESQLLSHRCVCILVMYVEKI